MERRCRKVRLLAREKFKCWIMQPELGKEGSKYMQGMIEMNNHKNWLLNKMWLENCWSGNVRVS